MRDMRANASKKRKGKTLAIAFGSVIGIDRAIHVLHESYTSFVTLGKEKVSVQGVQRKCKTPGC